MATVFRHRNVWINDSGRVEVYCYKLAKKINKELRRYEDGNYSFKPGEEAIFFIQPSQTQSFIVKFL
jgi:hypothetical protein